LPVKGYFATSYTILLDKNGVFYIPTIHMDIIDNLIMG
jgi:hypothetical protein